MRRWPFVLMLLGQGCGGASIQGGRSLPPGTIVTGTVLQSYRPTACRDAKGEHVPPPAVVVWVIRPTGTTRQVLVETRAGHESLLVRRGFPDGNSAVYQVGVVGGAGDVVREYRVSREQTGGALSVLTSWHEISSEPFRVKAKSTALLCVLGRHR
jgi:hypothetical protein